MSSQEKQTYLEITKDRGNKRCVNTAITRPCCSILQPADERKLVDWISVSHIDDGFRTVENMYSG